MELQQLIGAEWQRGVGASLVVAKFDFIHTGCQPLHDRANLAAPNCMAGAGFQQGHHGKQPNSGIRF